MNQPTLFEFFVEGKNQQASHVLLHITEPSTPEEQEKGYFFALVEMEQATPDTIEHMQRLIDDLETGYYETTEEGDQSAFETTLEFLNRRSDLVLGEQTKVHCLVGVLRGGEVSFAYHGTPHALVWYSQKGEGRIMNIIEEDQEQNQQELFSEVLQGTIHLGDILFLASPHTSNYFSYDRIEKILSSRPPKEAANHIQKVLLDLREDVSFGGIVVQLQSEAERPKTGKLPKTLTGGAAASLNHLLSAEVQTRETLSPPILSQMKKQWQKNKQERASSKIETTQKQKHRRGQKKQDHSETNYRPRQNNQTDVSEADAFLIRFGRILVQTLLKFGQLLFFILTFFWKTILILFILLTNKNNGRKEVFNRAKLRIYQVRLSYKNLSMPSKILLLATVIFAIIFFVSVLYLHIRSTMAIAAAEIQGRITAVEDKTAAAEARLIYGDEVAAFGLLKEAEDLLTTLPEKKSAEIEAKHALGSKIEEKLRLLRKIEVVNTQKLVDYTAKFPSSKVERLVKIGSNILAYSHDDSSLYVTNLTTSETEAVPHTNFSSIISASTPKENDMVIFVGKDNSIGQFDPNTKGVEHREISFPQLGTAIIDAFVYNIRLYTLDPTNGQIYKHNKTQAGYEKGTPWISATTDLSHAVSLAIDGDMFVAENTGNIRLFSKGVEIPFEIIGLDPPLLHPTTIWTYNDVDELYILEPDQKRVVVLNKSGKLLHQLTSDTWTHPTSMVVDPDAKILYVLDNQILYSVPLTQ